MLRSLRTGAKSPLMRILLVVLAIGFAMWGIDDVFLNVGNNAPAVQASKHEVTAIEAATEFDRIRRVYLPNSNNAEAIGQGLLNEVLTGMARQATFSAEADRLKLTVTRAMEKAEIAREPAFQDSTGRFSLLQFQDALAQSGLNEETYLQRIAFDLNRQQIFDAIASGIRYPEPLAKTIAKWRLERRSINYTEINVDEAAAALPTDSEIDRWYSENSEAYDSPDLRGISAIVLSPETLLGEVDVSDEETRRAYDERRDLFERPEYRQIRQMIFTNLEAANNAASKIKTSEDFIAVAQDSLGLNENDTALGALRKDDLSPDLADAVFAGKKGQVIGPISTPLGQHVLIIEDIIAGSVIAFENVAENLADELRREGAIDLVYNRIALLEDSLASGATMAEAARASGGELLIIEGMDRNGRSIDGASIEGIANDTQFRNSVWTQPIGEVGLVEETNADTFYVLHVTSEKPSTGRPLADVKTRVIADMKIERAIKAARDEAMRLIEEKSGGGTVSAKMRRDGVGFDHASARLIASKAFDLGLNETDFVETGTQAIVITVASIEQATAEALTEETARLQENLQSDFALSSEATLANGLANKHKTTVNAGVVQNILVGQPN